jgi:LacI family transcriptional regulator
VFPTLSVGDFARATNAVQHELLGLGYTLLLACSEYDSELELQQVRKFVERGVDGLILVGRAHHPNLHRFLDQQAIPHVFTFVFDGQGEGVCIGPDNRKAMVELTNYLADLGHRCFAVIAQSTENNDRARARLEGIQDALAMRGLAVRPQHMAIGKWTIAEGRALFRQLLDARPRPTAVICGNAHLAVGAMIEALDCGVAVPGEMSIVSYDDIEIMSHLPVSITALRVPSEEVGRSAARYVVGLVEDRALDVTFEAMPELLVRQSSGPPPSAVPGGSKA